MSKGGMATSEGSMLTVTMRTVMVLVPMASAASAVIARQANMELTDLPSLAILMERENSPLSHPLMRKGLYRHLVRLSSSRKSLITVFLTRAPFYSHHRLKEWLPPGSSMTTSSSWTHLILLSFKDMPWQFSTSPPMVIIGSAMMLVLPSSAMFLLVTGLEYHALPPVAGVVLPALMESSTPSSLNTIPFQGQCPPRNCLACALTV
mmetsp:Transcript_8741/g.16073  ORF Transcript_8741/g.16073 Transcript_8741/m.16073 type:complete len:206 (+) Transcript_8741:296-913(+)